LEDLNDGHRYAGVTVRNPFDDLVPKPRPKGARNGRSGRKD
jgi:hypothetical protein